jgi:hypothetical protein
VEQEGLWGLLHFTEPHCYAPFLIITAALGFGFMGIAGLWEGVNLATRLLATVATVGGCLVIIQGVYEGRHKLRETELLTRVGRRRKGIEIGFSAQLKTILVPVMAVGLVLLLAYALVQSDVLWKLSEWLFLEDSEEGVPPPPPEESKPSQIGFRERVKRALPLILLGGYIGLSLALVYSSSMMLARCYINRLNEFLPQPIFLQDENLARIVRREAEVELGRLAPESTNESWMGYVQVGEQLKTPFPLLPPGAGAPVAAGIPLSQQVEGWWQAANWVWDELERTDDGSIEMKVARQDIYQLPKATKNSGHQPHPRVSYVVRADPWGRITEIKRDEGKKEKE